MRVSLLTERSIVQARSTHIRPRKDEGNFRGTPNKCAARSGYETSLLSRCTERERRQWTSGKVPDLVVLRIIDETTVVALTYGMENKDKGRTSTVPECLYGGRLWMAQVTTGTRLAWVTSARHSRTV